MTDDAILQASTLNEVRYYLMVAPCPQCLKGPRVIDQIDARGDPTQKARVHCQHCRQENDLVLRCAHLDVGHDDGDECVNPDPTPSTLIDVGQWLSLFYLMVESAAAQTSKPEARRIGYRAAICLAEALKFYGEQELPPPSAFFCDPTRETFQRHPGQFTRQRLREMQAKLPDLHAMGRRVQSDLKIGRPSRWKFWKKR